MTAFVPYLQPTVGAGSRAALSPFFHATAWEDRPGLFALRSALPLVSEDAPTKWVHLAYEGEWKGHRNGAFKLNAELFAQAIENLERQTNPIPLDFDHEREFMPPPWPARGWVHELKTIEAGGKTHLWGLVEFGAEAVRLNKSGGFRYCSVVLDFGAVDRVTGEPIGLRITTLALTDEPFIDGQRPIILSLRAASTQTKELSMKVSKDALKAAIDGLEGDDIDMAKLKAAMDYAAAQEGKTEEPAEEASAADMPDIPAADPPSDDAAPLADKPEDEVAAADEPEEDAVAAADEPKDAIPAGDMPEEIAAMEPAAGGGEADAALAPLLEATGLDIAGLAAAIMENREALAALLSGDRAPPAADAPLSVRESDLALSARDTTIRALSQENETLRAFKLSQERKEAESDVDVLVEGGFILGDSREDWVQVRLSSRARFDKMSAGLKPVVPLGSHAKSVTPAAKDAPEETPINEDDPMVKSLRLQLSATNLPKSKQDATIRRHVVARG